MIFQEEKTMTAAKISSSNNKNYLRLMTVTAMLMAMNIALSSFGVPVPGGHLYLNDIVICTAGILLNPFGVSPILRSIANSFLRKLILV